MFPFNCPKKQQRLFLEVCKALCPTSYLDRLDMRADGRIVCKFAPESEKRIRRHNEKVAQEMVEAEYL